MCEFFFFFESDVLYQVFLSSSDRCYFSHVDVPLCSCRSSKRRPLCLILHLTRLTTSVWLSRSTTVTCSCTRLTPPPSMQCRHRRRRLLRQQKRSRCRRCRRCAANCARTEPKRFACGALRCVCFVCVLFLVFFFREYCFNYFFQVASHSARLIGN